MNFLELKTKHQQEVNEFPFGFAFSNSQFDEMMKKWGLNPETDLDKIVSIGAGGFVQKKDVEAMNEMFSRHNKETKELYKNTKELENAFVYEMHNHEYGINYQRDYDVLSCFGEIEYHGYKENELELYFDELGFNDDERKAYIKAIERYWRECDE